MAQLPPDHAERALLAAEAHARPPEVVQTPSRACHLGVLIEPGDREREIDHLRALCDIVGVMAPQPGADHFSMRLREGVRLKWERHGEFSDYTLLAPGTDASGFGTGLLDQLPAGWMRDVPGRTLVAVQALIERAPQGAPESTDLAGLFDGATPIGAEIGDGAGMAFTDFRVHADGFSRIVVFDRRMTPRQAGRMLQRLFEIEDYRMFALLALPIARRLLPRIGTIEQSLAGLIDSISKNEGEDEALLRDLTRLATEIESELAASQFRFGACRAYDALVRTRIRELREQRIQGMPPIEEFMARRFAPAVATCQTAASRLQDLSERVTRASRLLSTRVEIAHERQNQALLASMDRRARLQLRLQHTVEGLSLAAIVYYVSGIAGYLAKAAKAGGLPLNPDLVVGLTIPLAAIVLVRALRKTRRMLQVD